MIAFRYLLYTLNQAVNIFQSKSITRFHLSYFLTIFFPCVTQSNENGRGKGQTVKLSKLNGLKKTEEEEDVREMITPALREALTKQGGDKTCFLSKLS